jgi:hypothetical protein
MAGLRVEREHDSAPANLHYAASAGIVALPVVGYSWSRHFAFNRLRPLPRATLRRIALLEETWRH